MIGIDNIILCMDNITGIKEDSFSLAPHLGGFFVIPTWIDT